jgi:tRNA-Thr(GGU) m(6)t(6)A37 methyltransferase TsaA
MTMKVHFNPIGRVKSPYLKKAPRWADEKRRGDFRLVIFPKFAEGLYTLGRFKYIYVISYLHKSGKKYPLKVNPPVTPGRTVGVFASRSPQRPNPIGLTIVRLKKIRGNEVHTGGLDLLDGTPILDLKPYLKESDAKTKTDNGRPRKEFPRKKQRVRDKGRTEG